MAIPTEITFHEIPHSDSVEAAIHRWVARLEHISDRIVRCEVRVEQPHKSHRHGREFEVHLLVGIPGTDIVASRVKHEDPYVAVADAFRCARRQLLDAIDHRREFVKAPARQVTNL